MTQPQTTSLMVVESETTLLDKTHLATTLGREVTAWLDWLAIANRADATIDQYERDLSRLCNTYPALHLTDVTDVELADVLRTFPPAGRHTRKAAYESFFHWAIQTRRLTANPMAYLPPIKRNTKRVYDTFGEAEIDDMANLTRADSVLCLILVEAGLRKSEATNLQVRRLRLDPGYGEIVIVRGKGGKDRSISMTARLRDAVETFLLLEQLDAMDYLWYTRPSGRSVSRSRPVGDGSFDRWWRRSLNEAGVRYRKPHMARHTYATRWLRRGGRLETLSGQMGHASIKTTFDEYAHLDTRDVLRDIALLDAAT